MVLEGFVFATSLVLGLLPLLLGVWRPRSRALVALVVALVVVASSAGTWATMRLRQPVVAEEDIEYRPVRTRRDGYVSSDSCQACHPREYATWYRSFHRTMTQLPTPQTVLGNFDGTELEYLGRRFRLERRGDEFWFARFLHEEGDAQRSPTERIEHRIVLTTGSHHVQVYWYATHQSGRLATMPFVYLVREREWIPLIASFVTPPSQFFYEDASRWSAKCMRCHTTHGVPGFEPPDRFDAEVAEFGIACEACHGPGHEHVRSNRDPRRRYRLHLRDESDPTAVQPEHLTHSRSSQVCGQCHGIQEFHTDREAFDYFRQGYSYRPGDDLFESRLFFRVKDLPHNPRLQEISRTRPLWVQGGFWSDGMVRVTGREYSGLIESPCYEHGDETKGILSCFSCHRMHRASDDPRPFEAWTDDQLRPNMRGNDACLPCHAKYAEQSELLKHTRHQAGSTGSECYNCHMPYTAYGLLKAVRSHQIDNPTVQASQQTGRPNACNQCHLDKTLAWTADYLEQWYETPRPVLSDDERNVAASVLWLLRGDAGQRALMAWSLGWEAALDASRREWVPLYLAQLLDDPYEAVRYIAFHSLNRLPGYEHLDYEFTGPRHARFAVAREAVEIWKRQYAEAEDPPVGEPILIGPGREVRSHVISRLGSQRDDTPLTLQE